MNYDEPVGKFLQRILSMLESVDWVDETSGPNNDDLNRLSEMSWTPPASAGTEGPGLCEAIERFRRERGVHKGPHYLATAENPDGTIRTCAQCWEAYSKAEDDLDTAIAEGGKR